MMKDEREIRQTFASWRLERSGRDTLSNTEANYG